MPDALGMEVGRLDGRLSEVAARMDRVEETMRADLATINNKLDRITEAVAQQHGSSLTVASIVQWALMLIGTASGWLYTLSHLPK